MIMHLSMYCPTLHLPGKVGAKYGALTAKVHLHNYRRYIVISVFVKYIISAHVQIMRLVNVCGEVNGNTFKLAYRNYTLYIHNYCLRDSGWSVDLCLVVDGDV